MRVKIEIDYSTLTLAQAQLVACRLASIVEEVWHTDLKMIEDIGDPERIEAPEAMRQWEKAWTAAMQRIYDIPIEAGIVAVTPASGTVQ